DENTAVGLAVPAVNDVVGAAAKSPNGEVQPKRRNRFKVQKEAFHKVALNITSINLLVRVAMPFQTVRGSLGNSLRRNRELSRRTGFFHSECLRTPMSDGV